MNKVNLPVLGAGLLLSFFMNSLKAQEELPTKVTITITENDMVTQDTTFEITGSPDPEIIEDIVARFAGDEPDQKPEKPMIITRVDSAGHHIIRSSDFQTMIITGEDSNEGNIKVITRSPEDGDEDAEGSVKVIVGPTGQDPQKGNKKTIDLSVYSDDSKQKEDNKAVKVIVIKSGDKDVRVEKKVEVEIRSVDEPVEEVE